MEMAGLGLGFNGSTNSNSISDNNDDNDHNNNNVRNNNNNNNNNSNSVDDDYRSFHKLLLLHKEYFAEEEIKSSFPRLVSFVKQTEQMLNNANDVSTGATASASASSGASKDHSSLSLELELDEGIVESLVREFSNNWRQGVQQINDDILAYFANFRNGMEIMKQTLTQLLLYYTRFQDIIKKTWPSNNSHSNNNSNSHVPSFTRDIVSTATIMMEIKKYSRAL